MSTLLDQMGNLIDDPYAEWPDASGSVPSGRLLVSLERFLSIEAPGPDIAVQLPNSTDVLTLPHSVLRCPLLVLTFPGFADGRAYSQATLLSRDSRFTGRLRAAGAAVVLDQLAMLKRCGIKEFLLRPDQSLSLCAAALKVAPTDTPQR